MFISLKIQQNVDFAQSVTFKKCRFQVKNKKTVKNVDFTLTRDRKDVNFTQITAKMSRNAQARQCLIPGQRQLRC